MTNKEIFEEIQKGWGWDSVPIIIQVMAKKEILSLYWPIMKDAMTDPGIQDFQIKEGIMLALSSQCDNNYCFFTHSYMLFGLGFTLNEIEILVRELSFPSRIEDKDRWDKVLRWSFFFGRPPGLSGSSKEANFLVPHILNELEYRALYKVCSVIDLLNRFSEFYIDQIHFQKEKKLLDSTNQFKLIIPDLTQFYQKMRSFEKETEHPVVSICMYCKDIKDPLGKWHALETVLSHLDRNSMFSHSFCPKCKYKVDAELDF